MSENETDDKLLWETAKPQELPKPTYFPFLLAFFVMLLAWGLISLWVISIAGIIGICISLAGWINDMLYEQRSDD